MGDPLRPVDGIVWDLDGTLIDSDLYIVLNYVHMYRQFRPGYFPHLREIINFSGPTLEEVFGREFPKVPFETLWEEFRSFSKKYENKYCRIYDGEQACLKTIKAAGIKQCIVSNKRHDPIMDNLKAFGLEQYMDLVLGLDDVGKGKPDPTGVLRALEMMKTAPGRTIIIGDSLQDIQAGQRAGIKTGLVTWSLKGLPNIVSDHEFDTYREIEEYLTDGKPSARDKEFASK